MLMAIMAINY